ncbi:hypothetical protein DFP72DRAFT_912659 [Ephemerocybe angulata]|uniref:Uncharacterized protein n=1 Tax=Ephemerocybe angulata TaxID=980116 RepID=A0A8H6M2E5_9AGAR|nr:hypothetical protein DFP72DRAFT_912659 [Tulosesus angulatus]
MMGSPQPTDIYWNAVGNEKPRVIYSPAYYQTSQFTIDCRRSTYTAHMVLLLARLGLLTNLGWTSDRSLAQKPKALSLPEAIPSLFDTWSKTIDNSLPLPSPPASPVIAALAQFLKSWEHADSPGPTHPLPSRNTLDSSSTKIRKAKRQKKIEKETQPSGIEPTQTTFLPPLSLDGRGDCLSPDADTPAVRLDTSNKATTSAEMVFELRQQLGEMLQSIRREARDDFSQQCWAMQTRLHDCETTIQQMTSAAKQLEDERAERDQHISYLNEELNRKEKENRQLIFERDNKIGEMNAAMEYQTMKQNRRAELLLGDIEQLRSCKSYLEDVIDQKNIEIRNLRRNDPNAQTFESMVATQSKVIAKKEETIAVLNDKLSECYSRLTQNNAQVNGLGLYTYPGPPYQRGGTWPYMQQWTPPESTPQHQTMPGSCPTRLVRFV